MGILSDPRHCNNFRIILNYICMYVCMYKLADIVREFGFWTPDPTRCVYDLPAKQTTKSSSTAHFSGYGTAWTKDKFQNTRPVGRKREEGGGLGIPRIFTVWAR